MPRTLTPCSTPGCPELVPRGHCPTHAPKPWAGSTRRKRLPPDWARRKATVLRRDRHTCQPCGAPATQVDHIRPGDNNSLNNLQAICDACHRAKSSAEGNAARWQRH